MDDGCKDITLERQWNSHKEGSIVRVDPLRAKWLVDNDFGKPTEVERKPRKRSKK